MATKLFKYSVQVAEYTANFGIVFADTKAEAKNSVIVKYAAEANSGYRPFKMVVEVTEITQTSGIVHIGNADG